MTSKKKILGICGSASPNSRNLQILKYISGFVEPEFSFELIDDLTVFPHFRTDITDHNVPQRIKDFREQVLQSDGVIICTPEYVFSIPSGLKNILEWCVSTTVFSDKPMGLITASASGEKGHEELKLILKTIQSNFTNETTLLISGVKGKISNEGLIKDPEIKSKIEGVISSLKYLIVN